MFMYCITHEEWFHGTEEDLGDNTNVGGCVVSLSAPPEFEMTDEWVQSLVPPTDDELLVMYLNSLELEMDFS